MILNQQITISKDFIKFLNTCFKDIDDLFKNQGDRYGFGLYSVNNLEEAFEKFISQEWIFGYNCSDCSFPKFKNIETGEIEACIECGD